MLLKPPTWAGTGIIESQRVDDLARALAMVSLRDDHFFAEQRFLHRPDANHLVACGKSENLFSIAASLHLILVGDRTLRSLPRLCRPG